MPAIADLVLADGLATPVNHTFSVKSIVGVTASFEDRVSGVQVGYGKLTQQTSQSKNGIRRVKLAFSIPVLEAVSGSNATGFTPAAKVAYSTEVDVEFRISERAIVQNRKDIVAFLKNALSNANIASIIIDGAEWY